MVQSMKFNFVIFFILISSCGYNQYDGEKSLPAFCNVGYPVNEGDKWYIDIKGKKAFVDNGRKNNSTVSLVKSDKYIGLSSPGHLLVPTQEALESDSELSWEFDGYTFTVTKNEVEDARLFVISSRRINLESKEFSVSELDLIPFKERTFHVGTDVVYSTDDGVLAIHDITFVDGQRYYTTNVLCSEEPLKF